MHIGTECCQVTFEFTHNIFQSIEVSERRNMRSNHAAIRISTTVYNDCALHGLKSVMYCKSSAYCRHATTRIETAERIGKLHAAAAAAGELSCDIDHDRVLTLID